MPRPRISPDALARLNRLLTPALPQVELPALANLTSAGSMDYWVVRWIEPDVSNPQKMIRKANLIRCQGSWREAEKLGIAYVEKQGWACKFKSVERHEARP